MIFGLKGVPYTFQSYINDVLRGIRQVRVYMDDIFIWAFSIDDHNEIFNEVMTRLREYNLGVQIDKLELLKNKVGYLGHVVSQNGIEVNPKKVQAVQEFPTPKSLKNVRCFLGMTFYRRFIKSFAKIAKPLTALLKKNKKFEWNEDAEKAFKDLKNSLCSTPILKFPNMKLPFIITTDASGYGISAILSQKINGFEHPIAYASRVLSKSEKKYAAYELEFLAILYGCETFKHYIYNTHFTVFTDHKPLTYSGKVENNKRVLKWRHRLSDLNYTVIYKPGEQNIIADCLSRSPLDKEEKSVNVLTRAQKKKDLANNKDNTKSQEVELIRKRKRNSITLNGNKTNNNNPDSTNNQLQTQSKSNKNNNNNTDDIDINTYAPRLKRKVGRPRKIKSLPNPLTKKKVGKYSSRRS